MLRVLALLAPLLTTATAFAGQTPSATTLTPEEWAQVRGTIGLGGMQEALLVGQGDPFGQQGAQLGFSVALSGDTLLVGAWREQTVAGLDVGAAYVFVRSGGTWVLQQRLQPEFPDPGDRFGIAVALGGDTAIVGAYLDNEAGIPVGGAHVFQRSGRTWTRTQKLLPSDGYAGSRFGIALALSGDTLVVGASGMLTGAAFDVGSAYVFVRSGLTWVEQQKLLGAGGAPTDGFGTSVAIWGDTAVVGAYRDDTPGGAGAGSAYVFTRSATTWSQQQKLLASDGATFDWFGTAVAVDGDTLAIGAPLDDTPNGGSVYVFGRSGGTWSERQKLTAADTSTFGQFGLSLALAKDTLVVGAPTASLDALTSVGAAYVFARSAGVWTPMQRIAASDAGAQQMFGRVTLGDDRLAIGAPFAGSPAGVAAGAAYVLERSGVTWTEQQKLLAPDGWDDRFGLAVSIAGDTMLVGAPYDQTTAGESAGSAYVFVRSGATWTLQARLVPADGQREALFGHSVAVSGDVAVVGAPGEDGSQGQGLNVGSAYVFVRSGTSWTQQQKLPSPSAQGLEYFGYSVAVSGETAIVGMAREIGAAHVFVRSGSTWSLQQTLQPFFARNFGISVALSGDTAVVGSFDIHSGGEAHVFVRSGSAWAGQQILRATAGQFDDSFGSSVAISGDTVVVGALLHDMPNAPDIGAAYVFERSGSVWGAAQQWLASDPRPRAYFGRSVAIEGDIAAIGADGFGDTGAGYVFVRAGGAWAFQRKHMAAVPALYDTFGLAVSVSGDTIAIGAPGDDLETGRNGSVHVFRELRADLRTSKTDGQANAVPGQPITYTITVSNDGPSALDGVTVTDALPIALQDASWTCTASPGASCAASGSGNVGDTVALPSGGSVTYTVAATIDPDARGMLSNTVTAAPPAAIPDPNLANNTAIDVSTLTPRTGLRLTKSDSVDPVSPGDPLSYSLSLQNAGPSTATAVTLSDPLPPGVSFVSVTPGPPTCVFDAGTVVCAMATLPVAGTTSVRIDVTVAPTASGIVVNTATAGGSEPDPDPSDNVATSGTGVGRRDGELAHGTVAVLDLAPEGGRSADSDVFRIDQKPLASYEVVVDAASGDLGLGSGPVLERLGADGTSVLQSSVAAGSGSVRALRWVNSTAGVVEGETIRVRSAGCGTDCGSDDTYRIRAWETTYSAARFNNTGAQITLLLVQNRTTLAIAGRLVFAGPTGVTVADVPFAVDPRGMLVLNTATVPNAAGSAGSIRLIHDGGYGALAGKAVALEPSTGLAFDTPLQARQR